MVLALTLMVASCSASDPAQPVPPAGVDTTAQVPSPAAEPAIVFEDVALESDVIEASGAHIVLMRGDTRGMATLYSTAQQDPASIALNVEPGETVEGVSWAVEQDEDADPVAVALVYIATEASGLNATPDKIQMRVYNDTGTELSRTDLPSDITGTPYEPGDLGGATPSRYFTVVNGTAVFTTELAGGTYAALGYDVTTATETWRVTGTEEPAKTGASLANGWVALDWQDALTALDPTDGSIKWTSGRVSTVSAEGDTPYVVTTERSPKSAERYRVKFLDNETGAPRVLPDDVVSYAVDPLTGESAFRLSVWDDRKLSDKTGLVVRSVDNTDIYVVDAQKTADAGVQDILAMWNGYAWIETSAGKDVIVAATGDRAPGISTGDTVLRVPEYASKNWTITKIDGGTFGHDALILTRHPGGTTNLDDLNVLVPAPTAD
ncbi:MULTISPECIES: hypothetical protein [Microbacterium]|uniref:hypothetical protein n=1 Tax=Microbacterium TaxID=33882 RepID=UPI0027D844C1|nr:MULTISPECIES: hypothetical protein [Microbacterium]